MARAHALSARFARASRGLARTWPAHVAPGRAARGRSAHVSLACTWLLAFAFALASAAHAHPNTKLAAAETQEAASASLARPAPGEALVPLQIRLIDAKTGLEVPGNVRVVDEQGQPLSLERSEPRLNDPRPLGWHATSGALLISVPRRKLVVEGFQGVETLLARREIDLSQLAGAELDLPLERFVRASDRQLAAGNTHLHLMQWERARAESYLRTASAADQLDFVWVSYLSRAGESTPYTSNLWGPAELAALGTPATRFGWGEEMRHNFGAYSIGYGHVLLLDIPRRVEPVSIGPVLAGTKDDAPGLAPGMDAAHALGGTAIWAHGSQGYEDLPNWVLGRIDAQNLFDGAAPDEKLRGDAATFARVYYPLLDLGLAVPFSTGTDWFIGDLSRVYVPMRGEWSPAEFLAALRAGHSFITNGPLLELEVEGVGPGDVLKRDAPGAVHVRARAIGRVDFGALEVVANGRVVARTESLAIDGHAEAGFDGAVVLDGPSWIAARVAPGDARSELGGALFGHTSAVVVEVAGERPFRSSTAREVALEIDWDARDLERKGHFADDTQRERVVAPYAEAIDRLMARMGWLDWLRTWAVRVARTLKGWLGR